MYKKTRHSFSVLAAVLLFSSFLSGCPAEELASQGARITRDAAPAAEDAGRTAGKITRSAVRSEDEIAKALNINLVAAKAAQSEHPQIYDDALQGYTQMVQESGAQSLAAAQDAVQKAAEQNQTQLPPEAVYALAGGVAVTYATTNQ